MVLAEKIDNPSRFAEFVCRKDIGIGSDGLLIIEEKVEEKTGKDTFLVDFRNPDGSLMGMCGNGVRCMTVALKRLGMISGNTATLLVEGREVPCEIIGSKVRACLGSVEFASNPPVKERFGFSFGEIDVCRLSIGNPHCVIEVKNVDDYAVTSHGPIVEQDHRFPDRTNVEFVEVISKREVKARVWERAAGETMACGSGACAAVGALSALGKCDSSCVVQVRGGTLEVDIEGGKTCYLTGPAEFICEGSIEYEI